MYWRKTKKAKRVCYRKTILTYTLYGVSVPGKFPQLKTRKGRINKELPLELSAKK